MSGVGMELINANDARMKTEFHANRLMVMFNRTIEAMAEKGYYNAYFQEPRTDIEVLHGFAVSLGYKIDRYERLHQPYPGEPEFANPYWALRIQWDK